VLLERDGEDQLDCSCEKRTITKSQGGDEYPTSNKKEEIPTGLVTLSIGTAF
jgi:hypothetical protein